MSTCRRALTSSTSWPTNCSAPVGGWRLKRRSTAADVVVAVAPFLHGLPVSMLDIAVQKVLSDEQAMALPLVAGARGPVWAAACVIEDERRVAELADQLAESRAPSVPAWQQTQRSSKPNWAEASVSTRDKPKWPRACSLPGTRWTC